MRPRVTQYRSSNQQREKDALESMKAARVEKESRRKLGEGKVNVAVGETKHRTKRKMVIESEDDDSLIEIIPPEAIKSATKDPVDLTTENPNKKFDPRDVSETNLSKGSESLNNEDNEVLHLPAPTHKLIQNFLSPSKPSRSKRRFSPAKTNADQLRTVLALQDALRNTPLLQKTIAAENFFSQSNVPPPLKLPVLRNEKDGAKSNKLSAFEVKRSKKNSVRVPAVAPVVKSIIAISNIGEAHIEAKEKARKVDQLKPRGGKVVALQPRNVIKRMEVPEDIVEEDGAKALTIQSLHNPNSEARGMEDGEVDDWVEPEVPWMPKDKGNSQRKNPEQIHSGHLMKKIERIQNSKPAAQHSMSQQKGGQLLVHEQITISPKLADGSEGSTSNVKPGTISDELILPLLPQADSDEQHEGIGCISSLSGQDAYPSTNQNVSSSSSTSFAGPSTHHFDHKQSLEALRQKATLLEEENQMLLQVLRNLKIMDVIQKELPDKAEMLKDRIQSLNWLTNLQTKSNDVGEALNNLQGTKLKLEEKRQFTSIPLSHAQSTPSPIDPSGVQQHDIPDTLLLDEEQSRSVSLTSIDSVPLPSRLSTSKVPSTYLPLVAYCNTISPRFQRSLDKPLLFSSIGGSQAVWKKVAEASFSEVYEITVPDLGTYVVKVIPIGGATGGEDTPFTSDGDAVMREIRITQGVRSFEGFVQLEGCCIVRGKYPATLLRAWDDYLATHPEYKCENIRPSSFKDSQLYALLFLNNGGESLEDFKLRSWRDALQILTQVTHSLAIAESEAKFEHRDLHWGNVLVREASTSEFLATGEGCTLRTTIIDFTLSRMHVAETGTIVNNLDPEIFDGDGDIQFDVYRQMRKLSKSKWSNYLKTNILWLLYLTSKLLYAKSLRPPQLELPRCSPLKRGAVAHYLQSPARPSRSKKRPSLHEIRAYQALIDAEVLMKRSVELMMTGKKSKEFSVREARDLSAWLLALK